MDPMTVVQTNKSKTQYVKKRRKESYSSGRWEKGKLSGSKYTFK